MYSVVLLLHSWLRWFVLLFALIAIVRAITGAIGRRRWAPGDDLVGKLFLRTLDVQFLLGLLLYFVLSPITRAALSNFGGVMADTIARFWAVEHLAGMLVGAGLAHVGHKRASRLQDGARRHKVTAIFFVLALLVILVSIPWPERPAGRPLFRW